MDERIEVSADESGERLDKLIAARLSGVSRAQVQHLIEEGQVRVEGRPRKANFKPRAGQTIEITVPPPEPSAARGEDIPLAIVYEDEHLLVADKPAGMVVHPAAGHASGTLVNAVLGHAPQLVVGNAERPGIVHRLDRDTSGLIVIAKDDRALRNLQGQFASRTVHKVYLALVVGEVATPEGRIEAALARDPRDRKRFAVTTSRAARAAVTVFRVAARLAGYTLLRVEPLTGRTHQIRVHLAFLHHPVVGDEVYGRSSKNALGLERQFLHAWKLEFRHPYDARALRFTAPLPQDLREAFGRAGGDPRPFERGE